MMIRQPFLIVFQRSPRTLHSCSVMCFIYRIIYCNTHPLKKVIVDRISSSITYSNWATFNNTFTTSFSQTFDSQASVSMTQSVISHFIVPTPGSWYQSHSSMCEVYILHNNVVKPLVYARHLCCSHIYHLQKKCSNIDHRHHIIQQHHNQTKLVQQLC